MHAPEPLFTRAARNVLRRGRVTHHHTVFGVEQWRQTSDGTLMSRQSDIHALIRLLGKYDIRMLRRMPGQFTEAYTRVPMRYGRKLIHAWNDLWFSHVKNPQLAFGNILIGEKQR